MCLGQKLTHTKSQRNREMHFEWMERIERKESWSSPANPATQWRSKSVSAKSLPKTGIPGNWAGDFRQFLAKVAETGICRTNDKRENAVILRAFRIIGVIYLRLSGWRRSADRACLRVDSLLTGNFTGNFAVSSPSEPISWQEVAVLQ